MGDLLPTNRHFQWNPLAGASEANAREKQLVVMIIGLALAEAPVYFQLFFIGNGYPQNQIAILMVAVVCLIQSAPSDATPGYDLRKDLGADSGHL